MRKETIQKVAHRWQGLLSILFMIAISVLGCNQANHDKQVQIRPESKIQSTSSTQQKSLPAASTHARPKWIFIGDSLTAGFGVSAQESYVNQLQKLIDQGDYRTTSELKPKLINAGVSGDTSSGVVRRVQWLLQDGAKRVFLCIGANDGMRGQPIEVLRANLNLIIDRVQASGAELILIGMKLPPNYGEEYTKEFEQVYPSVAHDRRLRFIPFLLNGVAGQSHLNQTDGIHPNPKGHQLIAEALYKELSALGLLIGKKRPPHDERSL